MRSSENLRSALTLIVGIALVVVLFVAGRPESSPFSVKGGGPNGLKAMALLLEDLEYDVQVWRKPLSELSKDLTSEPTLLVITLPHVPIDPEELVHLDEWVEAGNVVLVFGWGHQLVQSEETEYGLARVPVFEEPRSIKGKAYLQSIHSLELTEQTRFRVTDQEKVNVLLSDEMGAIVAQLPRGDGQYLFVADGRLHTNRRIAREQNVELLVLTLLAFDTQSVLIAEAGFLPSAVGTVESAPPGVAARNLFFVSIIVGLWAVGRRLGPPRPQPANHEQLQLRDYIGGVARLYQRGRARSYALQILYDDLRDVIASQMGITRDADHFHERAAQLARRRGLDDKALLRSLRQCEEALSGNPTDDELIKLANELEAFRRRLSGRHN